MGGPIISVLVLLLLSQMARAGEAAIWLIEGLDWLAQGGEKQSRRGLWRHIGRQSSLMEVWVEFMTMCA